MGKDMVKIKYCVVTHCNINSLNCPEMVFIKYPKSGTIKCNEWNQILNINIQKGRRFICRNHFERKDFGLMNERVNINAKPSKLISLADYVANSPPSEVDRYKNIKTYNGPTFDKMCYEELKLEDFSNLRSPDNFDGDARCFDGLR